MLTRAKFLRLSGLTAVALAVAPEALAKSNDGIVRVKSAYSFQETIERLKKDVAAKDIRFFSEIDQSKLAADAGIKLNPSTLLVFGNPPLGTQFMTANPNAGLDWPVRARPLRGSAAVQEAADDGKDDECCMAHQADLLCRFYTRPNDQSRPGALHGQADGREDDRDRGKSPGADLTPDAITNLILEALAV